MAVTTEVKLYVTRTINLGDYNSVKLEGGVVIGRDSDDDTAQNMRDRALEEVNALINDACEQNIPARKRGEFKKEREGY